MTNDLEDKVFTVKETEAPEPIPVGMYDAKFIGWSESDDGKFGPYIRLELEIVEGEYTGTKRTLISSSKVSKGKTQETTSKLFVALTGLLGREPQKDENVSLKSLLGKVCQILVENRAGSEEGWQDVSRIMPAKK